MRRIARIGQDDNARILPALHLYAMVYGKEAELRSMLDEEHRNAFDAFIEKHRDLDLEQVAIKGKRPDDIDSVYWKHLRSFSVSWHKPELQTMAKETFRKGIERLRMEAELPISNGFEVVGIAPSNGYAFLAGKDDAVSYEKAAALARWTRKNASEDIAQHVD